MQPDSTQQQVQLMQSAKRTLEQIMFLSPDQEVDRGIRSILMLLTRVTDRINMNVPAMENGQPQQAQPIPQMPQGGAQPSAYELAMGDAKGGLR